MPLAGIRQVLVAGNAVTFARRSAACSSANPRCSTRACALAIAVAASSVNPASRTSVPGGNGCPDAMKFSVCACALSVAEKAMKPPLVLPQELETRVKGKTTCAE